ncbi:hypothetical protein [Spirosoma aureum]|nr:hypothetical protein [Spirosoma aureum]
MKNNLANTNRLATFILVNTTGNSDSGSIFDLTSYYDPGVTIVES